MSRRVVVALLIATSAFASAPTARADEAADVVVARTLFSDARTLAEAGRYEEACPKFEESRRLLSGVGTLYNLADCYEHVGRLASAWATFLDAAAAAALGAETERERVARARATSLEPRLLRLTIRTKNLDTTLLGLEVSRFRRGANASLVNRPQWDVPVPLDQGDYVVRVAAAGKIPWEVAVHLAPSSGSVELDLPPLLDAPPAASERAPISASSDSRRTHLIAAGALGGAAIVGLGVGTYFGIRAYGKKHDSNASCNGDTCSQDGATLRRDGVAAGNVSTVAFVCAGIALVGAAVVWLTAPPRQRTARAGLSLGSANVALGARF